MEEHPAKFQGMLDALAGAWHALPDKPGETPDGTLRSLWRFVSGSADAASLPALQDGEFARLRELVDRRIAGEPLSYLLGRTEFMGIEFMSAPDAMIPRVETEVLGRAALSLLLELAGSRDRVIVIDLCTGSGNVGLALAMGEPKCRLYGGDISRQAVRLAGLNAARLGLEDRTTFLAGDFLEPFRNEQLLGAVGLITCNPPYISTTSVKNLPVEISGFEPREAFDGGPFGLTMLMRLVNEAHPFLHQGGWVACETGLGQGEVMEKMFKKSKNYKQVKSFQDHQGAIRTVAAQV